MAQNDKNLCLSHFISQEAYIIWLWFLLHICKMMISSAIFFIFSKFCFFSLTNPMLITVFVEVWSEGHQEPRDVVSLCPAEHLMMLELATFQFWLQHLNPLGYSTQIFIWVCQSIGSLLCVLCVFVCMCVISNQSTSEKPHHVLDVNKLTPFRSLRY